jgi:anion-transporting  ArsA/GET3 family ATPase
MLGELLRRKLIVVAGKGGVGATTVAAALAALVAGRGGRALLVEHDPGGPGAALFGRRPALVDPEELQPGLWELALDGNRQLGRYLELTLGNRALVRAVSSTELYRYFVDAAPGLRELISVGRIFHEIERRSAVETPWDIVVFDAPASGTAALLLRMPLVAGAMFGESVVGREARAVARLLTDRRRCAVVLVTAPEPLVIRETLESWRELAALGLQACALVANRVRTVGYSRADLAALAGLAGARTDHRALGPALARARSALATAERHTRVVRFVARRAGLPTAEIAYTPELSDLELISHVTRELQAPATWR